MRGGLDRYHRRTVQAKRGRCLIFPHDLLHAGAPVEAGTKWVLRTDVVFSVDAEELPASGGLQHGVAVEWFREAQIQELDGNVVGASRLYERTLSLRRHAQPAITASSSAAQAVPSWNANTWSMVLFFLDNERPVVRGVVQPNVPGLV